MAQEQSEASSMEWQETEAKKSKMEDIVTEDEKKLLKKLNLKSVFVTGANRGLGLEFVRQLVTLPTPPSLVFATYRDEKSTQTLKQIQETCKATTKVHLIRMDVTIEKDVEGARVIVEEKLEGEGLTLLINNAGVAEILYFPQLSEKNMRQHFDVNAIGPVLVLQEFLPLLKKSAVSAEGKLSVSRSAVLNICAWGASIKRTGDEDEYDLSVGSCKMSKAALNMAMRIAAHKVKDHGILVVMMCPGWVRTDMGTESASSSPEESVERILVTLTDLGEEHHGKFIKKCGDFYPF